MTSAPQSTVSNNGGPTGPLDSTQNSVTAAINSDNVGTIKGSASISGGAAGYRIPIALPPGRAGMQPSVSIGYSSNGGNGLLGQGWSLSAGGSISRCSSNYDSGLSR